MSRPPNDPTSDRSPHWFPDWFPTGSQKAPRSDANRVVPRFPLSSMGNHSTRPHPVVPTTGSQDHFNTHLLQAAEVAKITGDAPGALAVLQCCRRCHPRDGA